MNAIDFLESKIKAGVVPSYNKVHHAEIMEEYVNSQVIDNSDSAYIDNRTALYFTMIFKENPSDKYVFNTYYNNTGELKSKPGIKIEDLKPGEFLAVTPLILVDYLSTVHPFELWYFRVSKVDGGYVWGFENETYLVDSHDNLSSDSKKYPHYVAIMDKLPKYYNSYKEAYLDGQLALVMFINSWDEKYDD